MIFCNQVELIPSAVCERLCTSVNVCERDVFFQLFHVKLPLELTDRLAPSMRRAKAGPWDWPDCSALYCSERRLENILKIA